MLPLFGAENLRYVADRRDAPIRMLWCIKMKRITTVIAILTLFLSLISCEGFKVLTIHNASDSEAKVVVQPGFENSDRRQINSYPNNQISDSTVTVLQPDSSMTILSIFTGMMFNVKVKKRELRTDYLRIETATDTVTANSRLEIIDLIYSTKRGIVKGEGRNIATISIEE